MKNEDYSYHGGPNSQCLFLSLYRCASVSVLRIHSPSYIPRNVLIVTVYVWSARGLRLTSAGHVDYPNFFRVENAWTRVPRGGSRTRRDTANRARSNVSLAMGLLVIVRLAKRTTDF